MVETTIVEIRRCAEAGLASAERGKTLNATITAQRAAGLVSAVPW
jgi:hypothetical protein